MSTIRYEKTPPQPAPEHDEDGYVYLLSDAGGTRVKVGYSVSPLQRMRQLQTGSPERLRLVNFMPAGRCVEEAFHSIYASRRIVGEWFADPDHVIRRVFANVADAIRSGEVTI